MAILRKLSEFLGKPRAPSGYRPGVTLEHVRRNLAGLSFEPAEAGAGHFCSPDGSLWFEARERTRSELLMHLVLTDFVLRLPSQSSGALKLELRHTGAIRRTGLVSRPLAGEPAALAALEATLAGDKLLQAALMPLDFKQLLIERHATTWTVRLEHMAASEVVNRMPSFRRYIRLDDRQRGCLIASLGHLQRILLAA